MPGQTPPESCHPPPEPPSHSPKIALAATNLLSDSCNCPVILFVCRVARINTAIIDPSKFVETAKRDPLGISFTIVTNSKPIPGATICPNKSPKDCCVPSKDGGIQPEAITPAFNRLK